MKNWIVVGIALLALVGSAQEDQLDGTVVPDSAPVEVENADPQIDAETQQSLSQKIKRLGGKYQSELRNIHFAWSAHEIVDAFFSEPEAWYAESTTAPEGSNITLRYLCVKGGNAAFAIYEDDALLNIPSMDFIGIGNVRWEVSTDNTGMLSFRPRQVKPGFLDPERTSELRAALESGVGDLRIRVSAGKEVLAALSAPLLGFTESADWVDSSCAEKAQSTDTASVESQP